MRLLSERKVRLLPCHYYVIRDRALLIAFFALLADLFLPRQSFLFLEPLMMDNDYVNSKLEIMPAKCCYSIALDENTHFCWPVQYMLESRFWRN
jgi:hypothetical protein